MRIQTSYNQSFTDPYTFQAQEHDDEVKGDGNSLNYKYRMHDPRLGRFFAVDPLANKYSYNSPYAFSENVVINANELEGLEIVYNYVFKPETKKFAFTYKSIDWGLNENVNRYVYFNNTGGISKQIYQGVESKKKYVAVSGQVDKFSLYERFNNFEAIDTRSGPDATYYEPWEGGAEAGNRDHSWEGSKGLKEKGLPLMAATVATIATGGLASGAFGGGFASTYLGSSLIGGTINASGNFAGQYSASKNIGEVDGVSVALSLATGFIPGGNATKSFAWNLGLTAVDAGVDMKLNGEFSSVGNGKSNTKIGSDLFFGTVGAGTGSAVASSGVGNGIQNARNFVVGGTTQFMNNKVNDKLK